MNQQRFGESRQQRETARVGKALLDALQEGGVRIDDGAALVEVGGLSEYKKRMEPEGLVAVLRIMAVDLDDDCWPSGAPKADLSICKTDNGETLVEMYIVRRGAKHEGWPSWRVHYDRRLDGYSGREPIEVGTPGQRTGYHAHIGEQSALEFVRQLAAFFASL